MKLKCYTASLASLFLSGAFVYAVDFVRQIQVVNGQTVVYDTPIGNKTGDLRSKPITGNGAIFQLYAYTDSTLSPFTVADANLGSALHANVSLDSHLMDVNLLGIQLDLFLGNPSDASYLPKLLSEKAVGTYIPEAQIVLTSKDTYYPPRTRADQPYDVNISVAKLPDPTSAQIPAGAPTKVAVQRSYKLYDPTLYVPAANGSGQGVYSLGLDLTMNGTFSIPAQYQQLPGAQPTKAVGEETVSASVQIGTGASATAKVASATIQVWPVATATIHNIPVNAKFMNVPENIQATLTDLYPDSVTYARIYAGLPSVGANGNTVGSSVISYNTYSPQNAVVPLTNLSDFIDKDGMYTIEVVTITPFNNRQPERLAYATFEINRTVEVRATLTTSN